MELKLERRIFRSNLSVSGGRHIIKQKFPPSSPKSVVRRLRGLFFVGRAPMIFFFDFFFFGGGGGGVGGDMGNPPITLSPVCPAKGFAVTLNVNLLCFFSP